jgi:CMP-N,N'-diacetyllegionaminic acid synthase
LIVIDAPMKVLGLIPARGGSKGVVRKNVRSLAGKPLILHTLEAARESGVCGEIFVSTDDREVASVVGAAGVPVPVLRPADLARDTTPMLAVVEHVLAWYGERGVTFDAVAILQPTAPLRRGDQLREAFQLFRQGDFDSLISVVDVPAKFNPHWVYLEQDPGHLRLFTGAAAPIPRRQDLPRTYIREGSIYLFKTRTLAQHGNIYGSNIGFYRVTGPTVNIDTEEDFAAAERLLSAAGKSPGRRP